MSLNNVAACFFPYGFERQSDGTWVAFNREYFPLFVAVGAGLGARFEKLALKLAQLKRDKAGTIDTVWLYKDSLSDRSKDRAAFSRYTQLLHDIAFVSVELPPHQSGDDLWATSPKEGGYTCLKWNRRVARKES